MRPVSANPKHHKTRLECILDGSYKKSQYPFYDMEFSVYREREFNIARASLVEANQKYNIVNDKRYGDSLVAMNVPRILRNSIFKQIRIMYLKDIESKMLGEFFPDDHIFMDFPHTSSNICILSMYFNAGTFEMKGNTKLEKALAWCKLKDYLDSLIADTVKAETIIYK